MFRIVGARRRDMPRSVGAWVYCCLASGCRKLHATAALFPVRGSSPALRPRAPPVAPPVRRRPVARHRDLAVTRTSPSQAPCRHPNASPVTSACDRRLHAAGPGRHDLRAPCSLSSLPSPACSHTLSIGSSASNRHHSHLTPLLPAIPTPTKPAFRKHVISDVERPSAVPRCPVHEGGR